LVVNGGWVQNTGNQIPNDRDLYVNGGVYNQRGGDWNSGSGAWETFRNLYMTGGSYSDGADGTSSGKTYLTNAVLAGGAWTVTQGHTTEVGKNVSFSGGTLQIKSARDSSNKTTMSIFGDVTISNLLDGAYAPLSVNSSSGGYAGGKLILYGDLKLVCNGMNTNTVTITTTVPSAGSGAGLVALNGIRLVEVGDGAASVDAAIQPVLVDNGAIAGGLTKTGAGTLALTATNGYTGATTIDGGTLQVEGSLSSPVTVNGDATLCGTGLVSAAGTALTVSAGGIVSPGAAGAVGTLSVTGDVSFAASSVQRVDVSGAFADCLAVSGTVAGNGAFVQKVGEGTGPWRILTASQITGPFAAAEPGMVVYKQASGTELWLGKSRGTLISVY
jgi:autotransporter-associated beta strand protein